MEDTGRINKLKGLVDQYRSLSQAYVKDSAENKAEDYVLRLFEILGWQTLGEEVVPQNRIRKATTTRRVDYSFKISGNRRPSLYVEVKKFSRDIGTPEIKQALDYGKNGGARWVVVTNFHTVRVFNSDYYDEEYNAELFREINLLTDLDNELKLSFLFKLSREACINEELDKYAKEIKKWRQTADVEDLLTRNLLTIRQNLTEAIYQQNLVLFGSQKTKNTLLDSCVQLIFDRLIFSRILEDNGIDEEHRMQRVFEKWESGDKRRQFYYEFLIPFFLSMDDEYDSSIFQRHKVDSLRIKNEDFVPAFKSFYVSDGLGYKFDAIPTDVLGHIYENYLSYKAKIVKSKINVQKEEYSRKQGGVYYTPKFFVDYLVKSTLGKRLEDCKSISDALRITVIDPACGSGTFLIGAYEEFRRWYVKQFGLDLTKISEEQFDKLQEFLSNIMEQCLYGIDIDPRAVELARLNLFIRSVYKPKKLPNLNIMERNSLIQDEESDDKFVVAELFPLVYEAGGFDIVLTNPPWEKWKPDSQEFFEPYSPGFKRLTAQEAKARKNELLKKPLIRKEWEEYQLHYETMSEIFRSKSNYQHQSSEVNGKQVSGDLDLYKLFVERSYQLLKKEGVAGIVIPSGIYTDLGAKGLREMLFEKSKIESLYSFENRKNLFPDIDSRYKPVIMVFSKGKITNEFPCGFFLYTEEDLVRVIKEPTIISVDFIKKASPSALSIPEIKSKVDYQIVKKMLKHTSLLDDSNVFNIKLSRGFDMTNDSHLFKPYGKGIPMLEGKNIHQFTNHWKEAPIPKSSILQKDVDENLKEDKRYSGDYWLAYRVIARSTDERTLISAIIPPGYVCGNSIGIIRQADLKLLCYICGVLNSFVLDYLIRQKVSANVNMFYLKELPIPVLQGKDTDALAKKVAQLSCADKEFSKLAKEFGLSSQAIGENDRQKIRAQIDATVASLYGITEAEFEHILSKFPIVDDKIKTMALEQFRQLR